MSTDGKPPSGSSSGRPAADTPQRLVVRSIDDHQRGDSLVASDTAVAAKPGDAIGSVETPPAGTGALDLMGATLSGRYLVKRKLGQGGMGAVYEATHTQIGGRYAVKVLLEKYARRDAIVARLKQEAQLATSLDNEHIIRVTDFGETDDGRTYVVMEFLDGESLAERLSRETRLAEQTILRIASQTASALAAAHAKGIVHRDIKPENVFLLKRKEQDFVKVVDFGISKSLRASDEQEDLPRLTQTGMVLGTPLYMSPEQARGDEDLDHRVDIYALGVIMYETATGHVPFAGSNYLSVISQVLSEEPKSLRELRPDLSEEFDAIVAKAMSKDRTHRYASATDMLADLNALLDDPTHSTERARITGPRPRPRPGRRPSGPKIPLWIAAIAAIVASIVVVVFVLNKSEEQVKQDKGVVTAAKVDAGVGGAATPPIDGSSPRPEAETVKVHIESLPTGASILGEDDGREYCKATPCDVPLVVHDEKVKLIAQLPGFDDRHFPINPYAQKAQNDPVTIKLVKATGRPVGRVPKASGAGSGSAAPATHAGGELGGYYHPQ